MQDGLWVAVAVVAVLAVAGSGYLLRSRRSRRPRASTERATYQTLHTASLAAPALRAGLTRESARRSIPHLRRLAGGGGVLLADTEHVLAVDEIDTAHRMLLDQPVRQAVASGQPAPLARRQLACGDSLCPLQAGAVVPLSVDKTVVGALAVLGTSAPAALLRLTTEVGNFVSSQLELAELDSSRRRADQAELRFLRAQISPHFVYNALSAIESFVRTDPERARELLVGFADFTRFSFRSHGQFVTMAEELRLVDTYLDLERARFGDRLTVVLRVSPEVLAVALPSLVLQPLAENAIRHGLEPSERPGTLSISITDAGDEAHVRIADDGVGCDPARLHEVLSGTFQGEAVGLHNVDERLRAVFGPDHGLRIESGIGAGTTVTMRIPKHAAGVVLA